MTALAAQRDGGTAGGPAAAPRAITGDRAVRALLCRAMRRSDVSAQEAGMFALGLRPVVMSRRIVQVALDGRSVAAAEGDDGVTIGATSFDSYLQRASREEPIPGTVCIEHERRMHAMNTYIAGATIMIVRLASLATIMIVRVVRLASHRDGRQHRLTPCPHAC
jgi:hypothetical protein